MSKQDDYYKNTYLPQIIRTGKWTCWLASILVFVPALLVTFYFGIIPGKTELTIALVAQISINAVWWFIEPVSFFPILGVPGTYMSFLTGNVSNLRLPCAASALKATDTQIGTPEGSIISTIGVAASIFVNTILLVIGVLVGSKVIAMLPEAVTEKFSFLLPALFGAVFAQFAVDDVKDAICGMALAIISLLLYQNGLFAWFPIDPFIPAIIIPIFGTMLFGKLTFHPDPEPEENTSAD